MQHQHAGGDVALRRPQLWIPVGVEPVSVNARDNNEVWVVNEVSDSISVVSVSNRLVMDTLSDYIKAQTRKWAKVIREQNLSIEK